MGRQPAPEPLPKRDSGHPAPRPEATRSFLDDRRSWAVGDLPRSVFRAGVGLCALAAAVFCAFQLTAWPPHEDETLALFVGRHSLGDALGIVLNERGGAPLHFLVAWLVVHLGGGLAALRVASALFAVVSIPVIAALTSRLAGRASGLAATAICTASWVFLFQAVFARMYSLFLLTSALSYLALLAALDRGGRRRWALWVAAALATVATHPYGALVLASQAVYVLFLRRRLREALLAFGAVLVLGIPFWRTDLVLAGRFDVGLGGGGSRFGAPGPVLSYFRYVAGDFTTSNPYALGAVLAFALAGLVVLWRSRPAVAALALAVFVVPALALLAARLHASASPESRHLIFALPLLATLVAAGIAELGGRRLRARTIALAVGLAAILPLEIAWGYHKTPALFTGEPSARVEAREAAASWLARTGRPDDVLLGYDPLFLLAWQDDRRFSDLVVPRADARLAARTLSSEARPLGRGVWVLDAGDSSNVPERSTIPYRLPRPGSAFEARVFGPYLVIRTRDGTGTPLDYLARAEAAMRLGKELRIVDADGNLDTLERAEERLHSDNRLR